MKAYKEKNYEQALIETYLKFDELLWNEKINNFLRENLNATRTTRLDITFNYGSPVEFNTFLTPGLDEKLKDENCYTEDIMGDKPIIEINKETNLAKNTPPLLGDQNLSDEKVITPRSSLSSPGGKSLSEDNRSKEILTYDANKIEISLRSNTNNNLKSIEELVAGNMGTTANILMMKNNYIYLANVGDSLTVIYKNGQAIRLNQEHKTTLPSEYTRINKSGSKIMNNRIEGRLNLTRAIGIYNITLGDLTFKNNQDLKFYEQAVIAYPEITKLKLTKDIEFIMMGCDGVWDCVDIQKLCEHISLKLKSKRKISEIQAELFDQIIAKANNSIYIN